MTSRVKPPASTRTVVLRRAFAQHRIHVAARQGVEQVFQSFDEISADLSELMQQVQGLALEIDRGVRLDPDGLSEVLEQAVPIATQVGDDLKAIMLGISSDGERLEIAPRTWSGDEARLEALKGLNVSNAVLLEADRIFSSAETQEQAEKLVARLLFSHLNASAIKAYDVAEDGSVRVSHAFEIEGEGVRRVPRGEVASHFSDWVPPEDYLSEAMEDLLLREGDQGFIVITDPASDERCFRPAADGAREIIESSPFVLIGEKIAGRIARVYKVDWESPQNLLLYSQYAVRGLFQRLSDIKERMVLEEERAFLDDIQEIAASEANLNKALAAISEKIAAFFKRNGAGSLADSVTIMLYDKLTDALVTRVIWTQDGTKNVEHYSGPKDPGIGRRIFEEGKDIYLRREADWRGQDVHWRRQGKGSLIGTVVSGEDEKVGVIIVSSKREDAFTQSNQRVLESASKRVGPTFQRVIAHLQELHLDQSFGVPKFGSPRVYNKQFIGVRLEADIQRFRAEGTPLALAFVDIDHFKPLNEAWIHEDVDSVLAEIFSRIIGALREGVVCRHGGEEIVVILPLSLQNAGAVAGRIRAAMDRPITVRVPKDSRMEAAKAKADILRKMASWSNHGIVVDGDGRPAVEVKEGRRGEFFLVVTVHKTVSVGVVGFNEGDSPSGLVNRADTAMQRGKHELGRNRVVILSDDGSEEVIPPIED